MAINKKLRYVLKHSKTFNTVYVCEGSRLMRKDGTYNTKKSLFVSMCGYGPGGRWTLGRRMRTYDVLKGELKLFWKYPSRKKELDNLEIECYNTETGVTTIPSKKKILQDIERAVLLEKLKGPPRWPL